MVERADAVGFCSLKETVKCSAGVSNGYVLREVPVVQANHKRPNMGFLVIVVHRHFVITGIDRILRPLFQSTSQRFAYVGEGSIDGPTPVEKLI